MGRAFVKPDKASEAAQKIAIAMVERIDWDGFPAEHVDRTIQSIAVVATKLDRELNMLAGETLLRPACDRIEK